MTWLLVALAVVGALGVLPAGAVAESGQTAASVAAQQSAVDAGSTLSLDTCEVDSENDSTESDGAENDGDATDDCDPLADELNPGGVDDGTLAPPPQPFETVAERVDTDDSVTVHVFDDRLHRDRMVDVLERLGVDDVTVVDRSRSDLEEYVDGSVGGDGLPDRTGEDGVEQFLGEATDRFDDGVHVAVGTGGYAQETSDGSNATTDSDSTPASPIVPQRETDDDSTASTVWSAVKWGGSQVWSPLGVFSGSPNQEERFDGDDVEWEYQDPDGDGYQEHWDPDGDGEPEQFRSESSTGEGPDGYDTNEDGKPDAWDTDGDSRHDVFDTNGDGSEDARDTTGNGLPDKFDTDGDGLVEATDTDGDGSPDKDCEGTGECGYRIRDVGTSDDEGSNPGTDDSEPGTSDDSDDTDTSDDDSDDTDTSDDSSDDTDTSDDNSDDTDTSDDSSDDSSDSDSDSQDGTDSSDDGTDDSGAESGTSMPEGPGGDCGGPAMSCEEPTHVNLGDDSADDGSDPGGCRKDMICKDDDTSVVEIDTGSVRQPGECGPDMVCRTDRIEHAGAVEGTNPGGCGKAMLCPEPMAPVPSDTGTGSVP